MIKELHPIADTPLGVPYPVLRPCFGGAKRTTDEEQLVELNDLLADQEK